MTAAGARAWYRQWIGLISPAGVALARFFMTIQVLLQSTSGVESKQNSIEQQDAVAPRLPDSYFTLSVTSP